MLATVLFECTALCQLGMVISIALVTALFTFLWHAGVDKLIDPLRVTIQSKAKANSVKQEFEKQDELKRSAMRAISALLTITDSGMWDLYVLCCYAL